MTIASGESAAITALQTALNDGVGVDDNALQIATDIIGLLKTWILDAGISGVDVPNGDTHDALKLS